MEYWKKKNQTREQGGDQQQNQLEDTLGDTLKSKKVDMMNMTIKANEAPVYSLESTLGPNDTIGPDAKEFLKSMLTKNNEHLVKLMKAEGPISISYKLPSSVHVVSGELPIIARWDEKRNHWRTDEILDFKYVEESRECQFKTYHFSPLCFMQDKYAHMPFQLWRIAPRQDIDTCMITIETTTFELNIEIKVGFFVFFCCALIL